MCDAILFDGKIIDTIGQARAAFGDKLVMRDDCGGEQSDDHCICSVDLKATAGAMGKWLSYDSTLSVFEDDAPT